MEALLEQSDATLPSGTSTNKLVSSYEPGSLESPIGAAMVLAASIKREREARNDDERAEQHAITLSLAKDALQRVLFQEAALAVTTLAEPELDLIEYLSGILVEASPPSISDEASFSLDGEFGIKARINKAKELFWDDVRYDGQLEFHKTGFLTAISADGLLMPRKEQHRRKGNIKAGHASGDFKHDGSMIISTAVMHSNVPHFAEQFSPGEEYKGMHAGQATPEDKRQEGVGAGTIALPLGEIIKIAPFARDAHYAVVQPRTDGYISKVPMESTEALASIGGGFYDSLPSRDGNDRVFFASPTQEADVKPDEYAIPIDDRAILILVGGEIDDSEKYGLGEYFPRRLEIDSKDTALKQISELQRKYLEDPRYKGRLVVPLRRRVFDHKHENWNPNTLTQRPSSNYKDTPTGL